MKKYVFPILFVCWVAFIAVSIGCNGSTGTSLTSPHLSVVDPQTDIPMLAYAFLKIKPQALTPLSKFCVAAQIAEDREALLQLIEERLAEYKGLLLTDEFTRKWLISKAQSLIGVTIDSTQLNILQVDDNIRTSQMKEVILLVCEGVRAYKESVSGK